MSMQKTFEILAGLLILVFMAVVFYKTLNQGVQDKPVVVVEDPNQPQEVVANFQSELETMVKTELGQPIEGYEPAMFMKVLPGLKPADFAGVEAQIGSYQLIEGELRHELGETEMVHSAAQAIADKGYVQLLENVKTRLGYTSTKITAEEIITALKASPMDDEQACTEEAKICQDGSVVVRTGPNCEFAECPAEAKAVNCSPESREAEVCTMEYAPVCGLVEVQCVTAPCDPVEETFGNACGACAQDNVISYTPGECAGDLYEQ